MKLTFRGVRGSFPVPSPQCQRYGGNTPCVQVETGSAAVIIDAGTGIRAAGQALVDGGVEEIHLLITHTHWDHIQGFPHFAPLYRENTRITLYSLRRRNRSLQAIFRNQQHPAFFPIPLDEVKAELDFVELEDGQTIDIANARAQCRRLNHPGVTGGFRLEHNGRALAYISDVDLCGDRLLGDEMSAATEPDKQQWLQHLWEGACDLAHGADLAIFDTFFLPEEYDPDWGHSRPDDALRLGLEAGVRRIALYHHGPRRTDDKLDEMLALCQAKAGDDVELLAAREGLEITL